MGTAAAAGFAHQWDVMARPPQKGLIENPMGKQMSVVFTDEGLRKAEHRFAKLFGKSWHVGLPSPILRS